MAEEVGFEPTVRFPGQHLSRMLLSTAQPLLQRFIEFYTKKIRFFTPFRNSLKRPIFLVFTAFFC